MIMTTTNERATKFVTRLVRMQVAVEEIHPANVVKCNNFRQGQHDRKAGKGCLSANGAYLDGWYAPDKVCPPYISEAQLEVFGQQLTSDGQLTN